MHIYAIVHDDGAVDDLTEMMTLTAMMTMMVMMLATALMLAVVMILARTISLAMMGLVKKATNITENSGFDDQEPFNRGFNNFHSKINLADRLGNLKLQFEPESYD